MVMTPQRTNPFPGLRPFELDEEHLFFGREGQSDELINRLHRTRFLGVVGTSGSGKSSLVRAGLLPSLYSGFLPGASSSWRIAVLRPGSAPIHNLAAALNDSEVLGAATTDDEAIIRLALMESTLRRGSLGLVEVTQQARLAADESLLIVVDQFEELFRFKAQAEAAGKSLEAEDEAAAFVKLLLAAVNQRAVPTFVVLTMRSDFLGDCAQFRDLPETLNDSQYLIPRLTREQLRRAIEGPVAVGGATITPRLVNKLLNDTGDNPDQLPILQHALMRTWDYWEDQHTPDAPLDLEHYEAIGSMAQALSRHADQIYDGLPNERARQLAETLFRSITDRGDDNREIRRPTQLVAVCAVTGSTLAEMEPIVDEFRSPRRSFLMPPRRVPLHDQSVIDISHESLMRNWQRLKGWVEAEARSANIYRRLAETAALYEQCQAGYLRDPELTIALAWQTEQQPNVTWAERYAPNFDKAMSFLQASAANAEVEASEKERTRKREVRLLWGFSAVLGTVALLAVMLAAYAFNQREVALEQKQEVETQQEIVEAQREIAERRRVLAESASIKSLLQSGYKLDALLSSIRLIQSIELRRSDLLAEANLQALASLSDSLSQGGYWEINRLSGHLAWVWDATFAYDEVTKEEIVLSADDNGNVKVRSLSGKDIANWNSTTLEKIRAVRLIPRTRIAALTSLDSDRIELWDFSNQNNPVLIEELEGHSGGVLDLQFSKNEEYMASGDGDGKIIIWALDGRKIREIQAHNRIIRRVEFSPDSQLVASASHDGSIKVWDISDGRLVKTMRGHLDQTAVFDLNFSPDGKKIASAGEDWTVRIWSLEGSNPLGQELGRLDGHSNDVLSVSFHKDGNLIASSSDDGTVRIWNLEERKEVETLRGHLSQVLRVRFSGLSDALVSSGADGSVRIWNPNTLPKNNTILITDTVKSAAFSPRGDFLVTGSITGLVELWSIHEKKEKQLIIGSHADEITEVAFSPSGDLIASAGRDGWIRIWDVRQQKEIYKRQLNPRNDSRYPLSVTFSNDENKVLYSGTDNEIYIWNLGSDEVVSLSQEGNGHTDWVNSVSLSPNGKLLATASDDSTIRLWDLTEGRPLNVLGGHGNDVQTAKFSPDGQYIVSGSRDGTIRVWNVDQPGVFRILHGHRGYVNSITFLKDDSVKAKNVFFSASATGDIKVWNIEGEEIHTFEGFSEAISSLTFSYEKDLLVATGDNQQIKFLSLDAKSLVEQGCSFLVSYIENPQTSLEDKTLCQD